jgi:ABC-type oligopeptide transport system substrate-binding subunit/class 3 adenylate cyclase
MQVCPECQSTNDASARNCNVCGQSLVDARLDALQKLRSSEIQANLQLTDEQLSGERKPVTILFTDIVGSTSIAESLDPEAWKEIVNDAHRLVSEAIYHYEGTIAQLLGDGVLAFFGAPTAHEDDPVRAAWAALDIQDKLKDFRKALTGLVDDFQMRVGIHNGMVVVGGVGTNEHREYLAIGDVVNVAARLQSEAKPGGILISDSCARAVQHIFELIECGELSLKGRSQGVVTFEIRGTRANPLPSRGLEGILVPHIGRDEEVERLCAVLHALCEGQGRIVFVFGEAGIGKSRLIEEARARCRLPEINPLGNNRTLADLRWLEGRALSYGSSLSYWSVIELLLSDLGLNESSPEIQVRAALKKRTSSLMGEKSMQVFPFLARLMGLRVEQEESRRLQRLDSETIKHLTLKAIQSMFRSIAEEKPTVLILEDMHWSDAASLEVLEGLIGLTEYSPLMFVLAMREDRDHGTWALRQFAEREFPHRLEQFRLSRLGRIESESLVAKLLEQLEAPAELRSMILTRADGNPLYLEEIVRHLIEGGLLERENGKWRKAPGVTEIGIPETLQALLMARIDKLEGRARRTLQLASVIGKSFLYRLLQAISEQEVELQAHLSTLQRVDMVREKTRIPELEYIFKHSMTQEAAYNSLLSEHRKEFHRRVGDALEHHFPEREDEFLGLLAHHFEAAEDDAKAIDYLLRAGDRTRLDESLSDALVYYRRALALLNEENNPARTVATLLKLALVHQMNFDFVETHQAYERAFNIQQRLGSQDKEQKQVVAIQDKNIVLRTITGREQRVMAGMNVFPLDPGVSVSWGYHLSKQMFAGLARVDEDQNVLPHIARSWEVLEGGTHYRFHLRDDVRWTNGESVTAHDFVWAWRRNLRTSSYASELDVVVGARDYRLRKHEDPTSVGVEALSDHTLLVRLTAPIAYFPYLVTQPITYPLPGEVIETHGETWFIPTTIVGNGPFIYKSAEEEGFVLERNPDYFGEFSGNLHQVVGKFRGSGPKGRSEAIQSFINNEIDLVHSLDESQVPEEVPESQRHNVLPQFLVSFLICNLDSPRMRDINLRMALAKGLNRAIVRDTYDTFLIPAIGGLIPPGIPAHSTDIGIKQNVDEARTIIRTIETLGDGRRLDIRLRSAEGYAHIAQEVAACWRSQLGINVELVTWNMESTPQKPQADVAFGAWEFDYPDPHNLKGLYSFNRSLMGGIKSKRFEALVDKGAHTLNRTKRMAYYREADYLMVAEEVILIPLFYGGNRLDLAQPWVKEYRTNEWMGMNFESVTLGERPIDLA